MYSLLEYSDNYSMTTGRLWNCCRDEVNDEENENNDEGNKENDIKTIKSKSFENKAKTIGSTPDNTSR